MFKFKKPTLALAAAGLLAAGFVSNAIAADTTTTTNGNTVKCIGGNACKGKGACKTAVNSCKGQNTCKGKGFAYCDLFLFFYCSGCFGTGADLVGGCCSFLWFLGI